jgi:rod shape-determining protein MreD
MTGTFAQRLDRLARNLLPLALSILLVLLTVIPIYLPGYGEVAANLALMSVFYWSVHRPELITPVDAFAIGLLLDVLGGTPPGMNAAIMVLARSVVVTQGRVFRGKSFLVLWWGFSLVAVGAGLALWLISMGYAMKPLDPLPGVFRWALTVSLFPVFAGMFARLQNTVLQ